MGTTIRLTLTQRTELLIEDVIGPMMKKSGFRKIKLVVEREHGDLTQTLQFNVGVLRSGGKSPAEGMFVGWVRVTPHKVLKTTRSKTCVQFDLGDLIRGGVGAWVIPMTKGPKREQIAGQLRQAGHELISILEPVRNTTALDQLIHKSAVKRWLRQKEHILKELRRSAVQQDPLLKIECLEALKRIQIQLSRLKMKKV